MKIVMSASGGTNLSSSSKFDFFWSSSSFSSTLGLEEKFEMFEVRC